jgi:hypothetical protein
MSKDDGLSSKMTTNKKFKKKLDNYYFLYIFESYWNLPELSREFLICMGIARKSGSFQEGFNHIWK